MSYKTEQLNELIAIIRDGQRFYEHAHDEIKDQRLQALFRDMAQAKHQVIQALAVKVAANHEEPTSSATLVGKLRQAYADARATLSSDEEAAYVAQLEEAEDRILEAFEDAMETAQPDVRALLAVEMPKVRACHQRMRELKNA
ncbi:PA2169 family four-helix-bundle protein [Pseudomonas fulva]|uniref:ferritin-like domain-containing protein n=1 Tax=Pseudomonas fulva TaxID=47880 RepID=UPI00201D4F76|nr:PA2169 family four-helix-bundle protein [Pseudomonas fulva]UQY36972.1 PA2169 family four-helix-bundle protein [Pseudomonas fulva]